VSHASASRFFFFTRVKRSTSTVYVDNKPTSTSSSLFPSPIQRRDAFLRDHYRIACTERHVFPSIGVEERFSRSVTVGPDVGPLGPEIRAVRPAGNRVKDPRLFVNARIA